MPDTGATDATEASPQMSRLPVAVVSLLPSALAAIEETAEKLAAGDSQALETAWRVKHKRRVAKYVRMDNLSRARRAAGEAPDSLVDEALNLLTSSWPPSMLRELLIDAATTQLTERGLTALLETLDYISQRSPDNLRRFQADIRAGATGRLLPNLKLLEQRIEGITRESGGHQTAAYVDYWAAESSRAEQILQQWLASKQADSSTEQMEVDNDPTDMDREAVGQQLEAGTFTVPGAPGRGFKRSATLLGDDGEEAADEDASSVKIVRRF